MFQYFLLKDVFDIKYLIEDFIYKIKERYTNIHINYKYIIEDNEYYIWHNRLDLDENKEFKSFVGKLIKNIFYDNKMYNIYFDYEELMELK